MIEGLSHMTFVVSDLAAMARIMTQVFGAEEVYSSDGHPFSLSEEKFFLLGDIWIAIMKGDPLPGRSYNHVAFKIADEDFELYAGRIQSLGLDVRPPRDRIAGEGRSLYFYDFDNHMFELHSGTLQQRLRTYATHLEAAA